MNGFKELNGEDLSGVLAKLELSLNAKAESAQGSPDKKDATDVDSAKSSPRKSGVVKLKPNVQIEAAQAFDDLIRESSMARRYIARLHGKLVLDYGIEDDITEEELAFHRVHRLQNQLHTLCVSSEKASDVIGMKARALPRSKVEKLLGLLDSLNDFSFSDYIRLVVYFSTDKDKAISLNTYRRRMKSGDEKDKQRKMRNNRYNRLRRESISASLQQQRTQRRSVIQQRRSIMQQRMSIVSHPRTAKNRLDHLHKLTQSKKDALAGKKKKDAEAAARKAANKSKSGKNSASDPTDSSGFFAVSDTLIADSLLFISEEDERLLNHTPLPKGNSVQSRMKSAGAAIAGFFGLSMEDDDEENLRLRSTPDILGITIEGNAILEKYSELW